MTQKSTQQQHSNNTATTQQQHSNSYKLIKITKESSKVWFIKKDKIKIYKILSLFRGSPPEVFIKHLL